MSITIVEVKNDLLEPKKAHQEDAGFDLCCPKRLELKPFEIVKAETGVKFSIPKGNVGFVLPRSSISLKGVLVHTGVIDCGYTGKISVVLQNLTNQTVIFKRYNRIAQLVITPLTGLTLVQGTLSTDTDRGEGGFGSSGE